MREIRRISHKRRVKVEKALWYPRPRVHCNTGGKQNKPQKGRLSPPSPSSKKVEGLSGDFVSKGVGGGGGGGGGGQQDARD